MEKLRQQNKENKHKKREAKELLSKEYLPLKLSRTLIADTNCPNKNITTSDDLYVFVQYGRNANVLLKDGTTFSGSIINGVFCGQGQIKWPNQQSYIGTFKGNKPHGRGTFQFPGGTYEGQVEQGLRHGLGILTTPQFTYEGHWRQGRMDGRGVIRFVDGEEYEGDFYRGNKHGSGRYVYKDGCVYQGEWSHNMRNGVGKMVDKKQSYEGEWVNDSPRGWGTIIWDIHEDTSKVRYFKNRYEGELIDTVRQGYGAYFFANSSIYIGLWQNSLKQGDSLYFDENGNLVVGRYKADRLVEVYNKEAVDKKIGTENFYTQILDLSDLMSQDTADLYYALCLRYNSQLKTWYNSFSSYYDDNIIQAMCLADVWKFVEAYNVLENVKCMAALNRSFHRGNKGYTVMKAPFNRIDTLLENLKSPKDYKDLHFIFQSLNTDPAYLDTGSTSGRSVQMKGNIPADKTNVHDPNRIIQFRHFVDILIRASIIRYKSQASPDKFKEMLEDMLVIDQKKHGKRARSDSPCSVKSSEKSFVSMNGLIGHENDDDQIKKYFDKFANNVHERADTLDVTAPLLPVIQYFAGKNIDDIVKVKIFRYFFGRHAGGTKFHEPITILDGYELTYLEFREFYTKWKMKHKIIQEEMKKGARSTISEGFVGMLKSHKNIMPVAQIDSNEAYQWKRNVPPSPKIQAKRALQLQRENQRKMLEIARQLEEERRIRDEEEEMLQINHLNVDNMETPDNSLSDDRSDQSDF